ncbi:MAG TPA: DUF3098 domain-containing protein [Chitinophagaceae bacterium]|nr:DUF3098 domain-containing protein [Chitinophagaceae bacterium]
MATLQPIKKAGAPVKASRTEKVVQKSELFTKENYKWMLIGLVILALGFFLMSGGKSKDPNVFNDDVIYSTTRITIAPILIIGGLLVEIFAIIKKPKTNSADNRSE